MAGSVGLGRWSKGGEDNWDSHEFHQRQVITYTGLFILHRLYCCLGGSGDEHLKVRYFAMRLLHAPLVSLAARRRLTDTTDGFRAYNPPLPAAPPGGAIPGGLPDL
jgi:hypothetical protein